MTADIWLLTDDRPGNRTQVLGTARVLGEASTEIRLGFNRLSSLPVPLVGATLMTLDAASRARLAGPWPEVIITAGRRTIPAARWIKRQSGGRTQLVLLGRKTASEFADLTIRCAYFRQPALDNVLEVALPPTQVDAAQMEAARAEVDRTALGAMPGPRCVFLLGGPTKRHRLDADEVGRLAGAVLAAAEAAGHSLLVVTSRRSPKGAAEAVRRKAPEAVLHEWSASATSNPYLTFLAGADALVVTGESESMLADAVRARTPLTIIPLPQSPGGWGVRFSDAVAARALGHGILAPLCRWLMKTGWVTPRRELGDLHETIVQRGWGRLFDGTLNVTPPALYPDDSLIASRIAALRGAGATAARGRWSVARPLAGLAAALVLGVGLWAVLPGPTATQFVALDGDEQPNRLEGGTEKNRIDGRGGDDILIGGPGDDSFVFSAGFGIDQIVDFDTAHDKIVLKGLAKGYDELQFSAADGNGDGEHNDLAISIAGREGTILLLGLRPGSVDASDFEFDAT